MIGLGDLRGLHFAHSSIAYAISADGTTVVGSCASVFGFQAFRWTHAGGMIGLGDIAGGTFRGEARAVSANGDVVVGVGNAMSSEETAFLWTNGSGLLNLKDYLVANGVTNLTDWTLTSANGVSADGRTLVGNGINPAGQGEGWIASLFLPGDVNTDGAINIFDINVVSSHWGETGPTGDVNFDGEVNIFDINLISSNWTVEGSSAATVPEPSSLVLAACGLLPLAMMTRRHRTVRDPH